MARSGFIAEIGEENALIDLETAYSRARSILADSCKVIVGS
jgi:hypothetical protein